MRTAWKTVWSLFMIPFSLVLSFNLIVGWLPYFIRGSFDAGWILSDAAWMLYLSIFVGATFYLMSKPSRREMMWVVLWGAILTGIFTPIILAMLAAWFAEP